MQSTLPQPLDILLLRLHILAVALAIDANSGLEV
jgi:hypothetical protein